MSYCPRVALVGCGWFACVAHIPALLRLEQKGHIEITALCSRSDASLAQAKRALGDRHLKTYNDLTDLLADDEIDLVDLVLPISVMPGAIRSSLRAGKHVVSEKPCAPTVSEALRLIEFHADLPNPPLWAVAENWRFKPSTTAIERAVTGGEIGTVQFADFRYMTFAGPDGLGWRGSPDYPGGFLLDSGVHFIALLRQVVGEVEQVSATVSQRLQHLPPADSVTAVLAFAGGAEGSFRLSFAAERIDNPWMLSLVGSRGTIVADFHRRRIDIRTSSGKRSVTVHDDLWVPGGVYATLDHCVAALRGETTLRSSPGQAMRDAAVIEAMLDSSRTKLPVRPPSLYPILHRSSQRLQTYASLSVFRPRHVVDCASIADVRTAVTDAVSAGLRVRAMGNGNSWAPHLVTRDVCLRLNGLNRIGTIDPAGKTVVVEAGVRLGDLTRALAAHGLAIPSLSFLSDASIGGAVATATHGTSPCWGTLSDFVRSMKVVLASGEMRTLGPDDRSDDLRAARAAVGMLGIIVEVELQVVEMPWVRFSEIGLDLTTFLARTTAILQKYEHLWVHWTLGRDEILVKCLESRSGPAPGFHRYVTDDNAVWNNPDRLGATLRRAKRVVRRAVAPLNLFRQDAAEKPQTEQVWISMQYGVSAAKLEASLEAIRRSDFAKANAGRIIELKFLKGFSTTYLGPNADGDAVLFNLWWLVDDDIKHTAFDGFEALMRDLGAKPHWGKLHRSPDLAYMRMAYPQWTAFEKVRAAFDPTGTFSIFADDGIEAGVHRVESPDVAPA